MTDTAQPHSLLSSVRSSLEITAKLVPLVVAIFFALSVLYDWGYLMELGLQLSQVPTTLADHTRSAILWLPGAIFLIPLGIIFSLHTFEQDAKDNLEAERLGEDPSVSDEKMEKTGKRILAIIALVSFLSWLAVGERAHHFLVAGVICLWTLIVFRATSSAYKTFSTHAVGYFRLTLVFLPLLAGSLFSGGYNEGLEALAPEQPFGVLIVRGNAGPEQMTANVIRSFEKFVIVLDQRKKIVLLKPEDLIRVEGAGTMKYNKGLLCNIWGLICPHTVTPP